MKLTQKEFNEAAENFVGLLTGRFNDLERVKKLMHAHTIAKILAGEQNVIPEDWTAVKGLKEGSKAQAILTDFLIPPYEGAREFSRVFGSLKNAKRCQQAFIQAFVTALKREPEWAIHLGIKTINKARDGAPHEYRVPRYVDEFGDEKRTRYDNSVRIGRDDVFWLHFDSYHIEQGTVRLLDLCKEFKTVKDVYENFAHKTTFSNFLSKDSAKRVIRKCIVRMADLAENEENLIYTLNAHTSFSEKDTLNTPRRKVLLKLLRL